MSETVGVNEGEIEENSAAEPVPDDFTIAEAGQPVEPDIGPTVETEDEEVEAFTPEYENPAHHVRFQSHSKRYSWTALGNEKDDENQAKVHNVTRFTQTFFKYMKNLSEKRFLEIINMHIDHEDKNTIFYRPSTEYLLEEFTPREFQIY